MADIKACDKKAKDCDAPENAVRPIFRFEDSPETSDLFFNSRCGYRAQYYVSPDHGIFQNQGLIDGLTPKLIACSKWSDGQRWTDEDVRHSLNRPSAKIWISEDEIDLDDPDLPQLGVRRWHEAYENDGYSIRASRGRHLHLNPLLEVKGAFIRPDGREWVSEDKKRRAEHINEKGFS